MESEFIGWLQKRLPTPAHMRVPLGDDAAVLALDSGKQLVIAADALLDGVHFDLKQHSPQQVGRKALAVNLSDLAAMASEPLSAVVTLALPRPASLAAELARGILDGMAELAAEFSTDFDFSISGGDTNCWDHPLAVSVTVLGTVAPDHVWRRSGGQIGDRLLVSGPLGGSILGRHLSFTPLVREAVRWSREFQVNAATDISDGLSLDAANLSDSCQCGIALDLNRLPVSEAAKSLSLDSGRSSLEHALSDGEDFELLLVMPSDEALRFCENNPQARDIGYLLEERGLWRLDKEQLHPLEVSGFRHG